MFASLFANPWILPTIVAASLPFIIEWLFRRRKQQLELPTLKFLLENDEQQQIKKQDRLLLILRTIAIIALVLAISRPLIQQSWLKGSGSRNVIIFIDNTASMNQQVGVDTSFRLAQKKAADIASSLPKDTPIAVGCLTDRAETVIENEKDTSAVASKIKAMKASAGAAPMADAFAWIKECLVRSGKSSAEVYFFSDMQKYSWKREGSGGEELKGFTDLTSNCELYLVDVGGNPTFNYIVSDLQPVESIISTGLPAKFRATVEVKGKPPAGKKPILKFVVDGDKKDVREIEVTDDKPAVVTFEHRFQHVGESLVEVLLEGDEHPIDNSRLYLCTVFDDVKVLVVDDGGDGPGQESYFLTRAIAPSAHAGMDRVSRFGVQTVNTDQFFKENLDNYATVVLVGNGGMNEKLAARLKRYVSEGGSLLMFMGGKASPYEYNRFLYEEGKGLLPCKLDEKPAIAAKGAAMLKFAGSNHPSMVDLAAAAQTVDVNQYLPVNFKEGAATNSRVVLSMSNESPAILDHPYGRGRVMMMTTSAGASWSAFPAAQEYPIMVQGLMRDLVGNPDARVNLNVGDSYEQPVYISAQHLLLTYPAGNKERLTPRQRTDVQNAWLVSFDHTNQQGLYAFTDVQKGVLARRKFVANLKSEEGDLTRLTQSEFKNIFSGSFTWVGPERSVEDLASKLHTVTELSPYVLALLTLILAAEAFLAAKFGRRRDEALQ